MLANPPQIANRSQAKLLRFNMFVVSRSENRPPVRFLLTCARVQFKAEVHDRERFRVVRLAGRLQGEHATELTRLCDESPKPVRLDLADLISADAVGLETLVLLQSRGAELVGASPYVALQLDSEQAKHIQE